MNTEQKAKAYDEAIERAKRMFSDKEIAYLFPELRESEDEKIRREIIEFIKVSKPCWEDYSDYSSWIAWLEKQGEQSIKNVPTRETILAIWDLGNEWKELTKGSISTEYGTQLDYIQKHWQESEYYLREKQTKQKHVNQPKFKVGDWITDGTSIFQIVRIENEWYYVDDGDKICFDVVHQYYHVWSLLDAKDGDVLACNEEILLFKSYSVQGHISLYCWYNAQTNNFHSKEVTDTSLTTRNKLCPASKEQWNLLYQKLEEEGYEWDAEKKELKKIEQNPTEWSEDTVKQALLSEVLPCFMHGGEADEVVAKLDEVMSTKVSSKPKQEWSEEDEEKRKNCIYWLEKARKYFKQDEDLIYENKWLTKCIDWLKSLKSQKQWKPSDEQIRPLEYAIDYFKKKKNDTTYLESLYQDLKRLMEE